MGRETLGWRLLDRTYNMVVVVELGETRGIKGGVNGGVWGTGEHMPYEVWSLSVY